MGSRDLYFMEKAVELAEENAALGFKEGGPFGAIIVKGEEIVGRGRNRVLGNLDPTAHAEVLAIRNACENLGTHDLKGCVLYTSCEPCSMCLAAAMWANIQVVYYGNTTQDADEIGFRDNAFYIVFENILSGNKERNAGVLEVTQLGRETAIGTFEKFAKQDGENLY